MSKTALQFVTQAKAWLGCKESDGSHKKIIDVYNSYSPLPRGYALSYSDPWCAAFVSAVAIYLDFTDIIPLECSCSKMIEKFKSMGCWLEDENRTPNVGDIIFYDWEDDGDGDNRSTPNHVGIVSKVYASSFDVIEGNKSNAVGTRTVDINGKYIRGYGVPLYESEGVSTYYIHTVQKGETLSKIAKKYGLSTDVLIACNVAKISNPDHIKVGWKLNIPINSEASDEEHSEGDSETSETTNFYAIGKRFVKCIEDIKELDSYKELMEAVEAEGD